MNSAMSMYSSIKSKAFTEASKSQESLGDFSSTITANCLHCGMYMDVDLRDISAEIRGIFVQDSSNKAVRKPRSNVRPERF
jgi:hypothetical protein